MSAEKIFEMTLFLVALVFGIYNYKKFRKLNVNSIESKITKKDIIVVLLYYIYIFAFCAININIVTSHNWFIYASLFLVFSVLLRFNWKVIRIILDYNDGNFKTIWRNIKLYDCKVVVYKHITDDYYILRLTNLKKLGTRYLYCKKDIYEKLLDANIINDKIEKPSFNLRFFM